MSPRIRFLLVVAAWPAGLWADLYLIAGSPTPKGADRTAAAIWKIGPDHKTSLVTEFVTPSQGAERIDLLLTERKVVALTKIPSSRVIVVDLDTQAVSKSCPVQPGTYEWVSVAPFSLNFLDFPAARVRPMSLEPSIDCANSATILAPGVLPAPVTSGHAGVDTLAAQVTVATSIDAEGRIGISKRNPLYLDFVVPRRFLKPSASPRGSAILMNDTDLFVYAVLYENEDRRILILDKATGQWSQLPAALAANYAGIRAFGRQLVVTDGRIRPTGGKAPAAPEVSAGAAEWRTHASRYGMNTAMFLRESRAAYGGILSIFDVPSQRIWPIETRQADSEVLLIAGPDVYYRISDRLYQAHLSTRGVEDARLLVQSEIIRDIHWAFLSQ